MHKAYFLYSFGMELLFKQHFDFSKGYLRKRVMSSNVSLNVLNHLVLLDNKFVEIILVIWQRVKSSKISVRQQDRLLIEVVCVASEYPQDGGWGALLLRLPCLRMTKDRMVCSALCVIECIRFDTCTCRTIILTRRWLWEKG